MSALALPPLVALALGLIWWRDRDVRALLVQGVVIFGLAGLVGSGRTELAEALFGLDRAARGRVRAHATVSLEIPAGISGGQRIHFEEYLVRDGAPTDVEAVDLSMRFD